MTQAIDRTGGLEEPDTTFCLADLLDREMTTPDINQIRACFPAGLRSIEDAEAVFAVERNAASKSPAWSELFVELITDFVVWGERPTGVLSADTATWLFAQIDQMPTLAGVATLVAVLDDACVVPVWFKSALHERALRLHEPAAANTSKQLAA